MLTARDIMTQDVVTIRPDNTVQDGIELLLQQRISGLPVVDSDGQLIGIVSEFALLAIAYDTGVLDDQICQHMTNDVLTVNVDDGIRKIADQFIVHRVRRVPVVDKGRLVGLISRCDVLKAVYQSRITAAVG